MMTIKRLREGSGGKSPRAGCHRNGVGALALSPRKCLPVIE